MKPILKTAFLAAAVTVLVSCGITLERPTYRPTAAHKAQPARIGNIDHTEGSQELTLHSMGLIGMPYRWGGNKAEVGFDCGGMIQFVYENVFGVGLSCTARDMATASRRTPGDKLKAGDLVLFSTGGAHKYSRVGLYIDSGEFVHMSSSGKTVQTKKLPKPFYAKNYLDAYAFLTDQTAGRLKRFQTVYSFKMKIRRA